ncbi:MAG TPA: RdgB/HAM1 family non-canonical purine NTP pyrophosphatase [Hanamia sp.]|nr:RdgB/HAM1 family non-canonical purine NTP pyrophosphatase [Hanamia sp.]
MEHIIFATNNLNKVLEVKSIIGDKFSILSLAEAGIEIDIPEPFETIEENAIEKARVIYQLKKQNCFSEDTGLEVDALNGEPGVRSARYAGNGNDPEKNIDKLLNNLKEHENRRAQFKTVICLILNGKQNIFDGICKGTIIAQRKGQSGFGYDPVFVPDGSDKTFGEMGMEEKNIFSHRKKAVEKLTRFLNSFE